MAENKKSFVLYCDLIHTVKELSFTDAGKLFKHILAYVNDENPQTDSLIIKVAFQPIKQQLKRDLRKWEEIRGKRSEAGKASANKRQQKQQVLTSVNKAQQSSTNPTVTVNVNDTVNVNENIKKREYFLDLLPPDCKFTDTWKEWVDYRIECKKKLTPSSVKKQIKLLLSQPNPANCINQSIQNQWQGLFEDKSGSKQAGGFYSDYDAIEYCKRNNIAVMTDKGRISGTSEAFINIFERIEENKWRKK